MELRQLRYFVRIIETGSMAAPRFDLDIGVSAPATDGAPENELAIRLQRTSRRRHADQRRPRLLSQAQLALRHADASSRRARGAPSGHVSVGMVPSTASVLGCLLFTRCAKAMPTSACIWSRASPVTLNA